MQTYWRVSRNNTLQQKTAGFDRVGGVTSAEIIRNAFLSVAIACVLMMLYIWIRFELFSGIAALTALVHDVLIMTAVVCILRVQVNSAYIAACLTIGRVFDQRYHRTVRQDQGKQ